jgi:hypothetical protein
MKVEYLRYVYNGAHARYVVTLADFGPMVHLVACSEGPITAEDLIGFQKWLQTTHDQLIRKPTYAALPGFNALIVPEEQNGSSLIILCPDLSFDQHFHRN